MIALRCIGILRYTTCSSSRLVSCPLQSNGRNHRLFIARWDYCNCYSCSVRIPMNHLFIWMDPEVVAHDKLIAGKVAFLNVPFFLARAVFFLAGWTAIVLFHANFLWHKMKHLTFRNHVKELSFLAGFLCSYIVTESIMSWDWIMSIDPHWFSTFFGWYVFASMFVSGITAIAFNHDLP